MPLGIVSDSDFDTEVSKLDPILFPDEVPEIKEIEKGRGNNPEVPEAIRAIIGDTVISAGRQEALKIAQQFGVSTSSVSAYANGATSTASYNKPNKDLKEHLQKAKNRIVSKARRNLFSALAEITPEKLSEGSLREISGVARDMSSIIKDFEPDSNKNSGINAQFILFTPRIRNEESFEVIDVEALEADV